MSRGIYKKITEECEQFVINNYKEISWEEIAVKLGCSLSAVYKIRKKHNLTRKKKIKSDIKKDEVIYMPKKDNSVYAKKTNFAKSLGYKNTPEAFGKLGVQEFEKRFKKEFKI